MGVYKFLPLKKAEYETVLSALFEILYSNMNAIVPSTYDYEEDIAAWLGYLAPALTNGTKILLMYAGEVLAGYFQYRIVGDTLYADEVEIRKEYQRGFLFYRFCQYLRGMLPEEIRYVCSYVNKENRNSIAIHEKLGMVRMGENGKGTSWLYRGERKKMEERFR